jgi:hypothetical protein
VYYNKLYNNKISQILMMEGRGQQLALVFVVIAM